MSTSDKTVSLNLSTKQYDHLVELAALIETVTDVSTDVETIASKLFVRTLSGLKIGTHSETSANEHKLSGPNKIKPAEETNKDQQTEISDADEKASPKAISAIVSSLQIEAEKKPPEFEPEIITESECIEGLNGGWKRFLGNIEFGARIAILADEKGTGTRAALSICKEFNQVFNAIYFAPNLVGDYNEMLETFDVEKANLPFHTKALHYLPMTLQEWKRLMLDNNKCLQYGAVVFDNASELSFDPVFPSRFPKLGFAENAHVIVQIYTLAHTPETVHAWKDKMDIVFHVLPDFRIKTYKNRFRENEPNK